MAQIKCKMCGGTIELDLNENIVECEFCGTKQTVPSFKNDKLVILHNRANALRLKNDFSKAMLTYENIIEENHEDAEAHWGLLLCRYGIEYVDDPKTGKKIPTCHRTQYKSIFDDIDYKAAIEYSDVLSRKLYQDEAEVINRIQKNILAISQKEEPYDIFICYKETDNAGKRTRDSVIAQEIYDVLTGNGYKVFFSKITLESKLGTQYEPHIFAALNSAKVMLVLGTKPEYFSSPWVKNEWNRFISIMEENGNNKYLIPCYRDMDAYELPDELISFQCQDMNKLGFIQDLSRGIDKLFGKQEKKVNKNIIYNDEDNFNIINIDSLLVRSEILISNGLYDKANDLIDIILNNDPKNARAYALLILIDLKLKNLSDLENYNIKIDDNTNYLCAIEFAEEEFKKELEQYSIKIAENIANINRQKVYDEGIAAKECHNYKKAILLFDSISEYLDSAKQSMECKALAKEFSYNKAINEINLNNYELAIEILRKLGNYKDSLKQIELCDEHIIIKNKKARRLSFITISCVSFVITVLMFIFLVFIPINNRNKAMDYINNQQYLEADNYINRFSGFYNNRTLDEMNEIIKNTSDHYELIEKLYIDNVTIIVNIDADGGTIDNNSITIDDNTINIFKNNNFEELKINKQGNSLKYFSFVEYNVYFENGQYVCEVNIKAQWEVKVYSISYKNSEGNVYLPSYYTYGKVITIPNDEKEGYIFIGWQEEGTEDIIKDLVVGTEEYGDKVYIAVWQIDEPTIIFDTDGGSVLENLVLNVGDIIETEIPIKEGYTFVGWNPELPEVMPLDVIKVTAIWQANSYAVTLDVNGGTLLQDSLLTVTYNEEFNLPIPRRDGYVFKCWTYNSSEITDIIYTLTSDATFVAQWIKTLTPFNVNSKSYIYIGSYPQTVVTDLDLIDELNGLTVTNTLGYIEYNGEQYKKIIASPYEENYKFTNGNSIIKGNTYYFKVEPIKWRVLETDNGNYKLLSESIIDNIMYSSYETNRIIDGETIYSNNYMYSNIRAWLNGLNGTDYSMPDYTDNGFYQIAFTEEEKELIKTTLVKNTQSTTSSSINIYACNDTNDKVYLLSYNETITAKYGFNTNDYEADNNKIAKLTDFAIANGCMTVYNESFSCKGIWWLRSPENTQVNYINFSGSVYFNYVITNCIGVRPALDIIIN